MHSSLGKSDKADSGEISLRWFADCRSILTEFAESVGKNLNKLNL